MSDNTVQQLLDVQAKMGRSFNSADAAMLRTLVQEALAVHSPNGQLDLIREAIHALQQARGDIEAHARFAAVRISDRAVWAGQAADRADRAINGGRHSVERIVNALGASAKASAGFADALEAAHRKDRSGRDQLEDAKSRLNFGLIDWLFDQKDAETRRAHDTATTGIASRIAGARDAEAAQQAGAEALGRLAAEAPARQLRAQSGQGPVPTATDLLLAADAARLVYGKDFADPGLLKVGDTYYAYGTNAGSKNVQLLTSTDLEHWTEAKDVLPQLGSWARPGRTWAPEVMQLADGRFALYYTAQSADTGDQAIGVAVANNPAGPFVSSTKPLISGAGDVLDASPFRDTDGKLYLQWKDGATSTVYGQQLSPDGLNVMGGQAPLLTNHAAWQANVVEAPQMHVHDGKHYLFYSGNRFDNPGYSVGYAVCDGPLGPCRDAPENPILTGRGDAVAPGHSSLVRDPNGDDRLLYHAWRRDSINSAPGRVLWLDRVEWVDGRPVVHGPAG